MLKLITFLKMFLKTIIYCFCKSALFILCRTLIKPYRPTENENVTPFTDSFSKASPHLYDTLLSVRNEWVRALWNFSCVKLILLPSFSSNNKKNKWNCHSSFIYISYLEASIQANALQSLVIPVLFVPIQYMYLTLHIKCVITRRLTVRCPTPAGVRLLLCLGQDISLSLSLLLWGVITWCIVYWAAHCSHDPATDKADGDPPH